MVTYKQSGVNIDAGNKLVKMIKRVAPTVGGFSGLYPVKGTDLLLSASSDGVGTKLKLAFMLNKHNTVGIDLVAMNVNDLICSGAKPAFFLDYFACGKLSLAAAGSVIKGIVEGCRQAGCSLLGGETAEMPGFYKKGEYDLAGFSVGIVKKNRIINGSKIKNGDVVLGLPSSGLHSNGFSLVHKVFNRRELKKYGSVLLKPTKIYVREINRLVMKKDIVKGMVHVTGGGFYENIVRVLPKNCRAVINKNSWKVNDIFKVIQKKGKVSEKEMYRVFNMGIGFILVADKKKAVEIKRKLKNCRVIGKVVSGSRGVEIL